MEDTPSRGTPVQQVRHALIGDRGYGVTADTPEALSASDLDISNGSVFDEYSRDPRFLESHKELRSLLFTTIAHSLAPTRTGSPVAEGADDTRTFNGTSCLEAVVTNSSRVLWLQNYVREVAPWLDMFDIRQTFGRTIPILAQSSTSLAYAILAISARQVERAKHLRGDLESLQLYQEAIKSLTPQVLVEGLSIIATCVILCCLEMMSAMPHNWRKHLDGCAALLDSRGINGLSSGALQAVFWCYARMDLCAAIISEGDHSTVLPLEKWLPPNIAVEEASSLFPRTPDMHACLSVFLCGRVCQLIYECCNETEEADNERLQEPFEAKWNKLWAEVASWAQDRPPELLPVEILDEERDCQDYPFPFILFGASCAISSNQLYHTACLLLLDISPSLDSAAEHGRTWSKLWHARRICGISATNKHHGCLNNAIQPLWVAGKFLSHPAEHKALVNLVRQIEITTGWGSSWRIQDLRKSWGYDKHEMP